MKSSEASSELVVFDLDDTLYPERDYVLSGFRAAAQHLVTQEGEGYAQFYERAATRFDKGERGKIFNDALADLGLEVTHERVMDLLAAYRAHRPTISLSPPAREILAELRGRGRSLGIITDGYLEVQRHKLAALGVEPLVDFAQCSDAFGREHWKPDPKPYRALEDHFALKGSACTYIGDNPKKDFVGARKLGWRTIRFRGQQGDHAGLDAQPGYAADVDVADWSELRVALGLSPAL